jgi:hypothetical protein
LRELKPERQQVEVVGKGNEAVEHADRITLLCSTHTLLQLDDLD